MVYIKSLICEGFKSFKHRTKINFSRGFTSIVGANGSGKSNILDAFVFALGELSGNKLRVNNIKDLICNGGSNGGQPSKWARVDVIFDNSDRTIPFDSNTIKISRKININGHGKYYINDKLITRRELQDIMDLVGLIPNTSNLILQGELFRIINMNNNERRGLIEEISGIAFYNEKKENAEKDLEKVEENISRITLLLNEVSIQLDSLEKEKDDALKYGEYDLRQKNAEITIVVLKIRDFERQLEKMRVKKENLIEKIKEIYENLSEKRQNLMDITIELDKINEELKKLQSNELKELTLKLNELKTEFTRKDAQKSNYHNEIKKLKKNLINALNKKDELEKKKKTIDKHIFDKKHNKDSIKENLNSLKEELYHCEEQIKEFDSEYAIFLEKLEIVKGQITEKSEIKNEISSEIRVLNNKLENYSKNFNNINNRINKLNNEIEKINHEIKELENKELEFNENFGENINIDELETKKKSVQQKLEKIQRVIDEKHEDLIIIRSKIKAIKRFSINKAVEAILKIKNSPDQQRNHNIRGKIYGTIAQLGKTDQKYNIALQVAGGNKFNFIVVDTQTTAKQCINYIKKNKIGRASFIPLDKIRTSPISLNIKTNEKIIGRAVDLIQFDQSFFKAFEFVFGRTIIVADIETASSLDINARRVTLDGDIVESSNLMTGGIHRRLNQIGFGSIEESKIPLLEKELNILKQEEKRFIQTLKEIENNITLNYKRKISANNEISEIRQNLAVLKDNLINKEHELKEFKENIGEIESKIKDIEDKIQQEQLKLEDINESILALKSDERDIKSKLSMLKNNDFTKKTNNLRKEIDILEKKKMKIDLELTKLQTQLEEIINNREQEIENNITTFQNEISINTHSLESLEIELQEKMINIKELEYRVLEKNEVVGQIYSQKEEFLKIQTRTKIEIEDLKSSIHPNEIKINTLEINSNNLSSQKEELERINNINELDLEEIQEYLKFSPIKLENIISESIEIKNRLEPVNMRAIRKYDKIKKRYDDLIEKHEIVVKERQAILDFIEKIEIEKKNTFLITFNGINEQFKIIFLKLSPGGEAKLVLENEEDPFAGGVKILARPGGKKWCLTRSMSGGEKTLTVVALILGIQMYIPSPYYILDEIDAAFDDYNAAQVASMIKELSKKSQFILITHRDVTMTKTDHLLGVSSIDGLTTILNLNMQEALEQIAKS